MRADPLITKNDPTLRRIRAEYLEMPGLRLSLEQARRLWGLDEDTCATSLRHLVDARFLVETREHLFARFSEEAANARHPATPSPGLNHTARRKARHAHLG